jgi:hypothetical protein
MTIETLKEKLQVITGTSIGEVFFDWKRYLNETRDKSYPCVLWQLDGAEFSKDARTATIQKTKLFSLTVFAIAYFDDSEDKITVWDELEGQFDTYLNAMNATDGIQIINIDNLKGQYAGEGLISADREVGIMYKNVQIKLFC